MKDLSLGMKEKGHDFREEQFSLCFRWKVDSCK